VQLRSVTVGDEIGSPTKYVLSKNLTRRHLTIGEKTAIALKALPLLQQEAEQREFAGKKIQTIDNASDKTLDPPGLRVHAGRSLELAADLVGIAGGSATAPKFTYLFCRRISRPTWRVMSAACFFSNPSKPAASTAFTEVWT